MHHQELREMDESKALHDMGRSGSRRAAKGRFAGGIEGAEDSRVESLDSAVIVICLVDVRGSVVMSRWNATFWSLVTKTYTIVLVL